MFRAESRCNVQAVGGHEGSEQEVHQRAIELGTGHPAQLLDRGDRAAPRPVRPV
jgi:hypothetical protein